MGPKIFRGAVKITAATAENRAIALSTEPLEAALGERDSVLKGFETPPAQSGFPSKSQLHIGTFAAWNSTRNCVCVFGHSLTYAYQYMLLLGKWLAAIISDLAVGHVKQGAYEVGVASIGHSKFVQG